MKHFYRIFLIVFSANLFFLQTVSACEIVVVSLRKEFRNSKDVFFGEITSVKKDKYYYQITFKVLKSWKGRNQKQLIIESSEHCNCPNRNFNFETGKQFIVFTRADYDNKVTFEPCPLYSYQIDKEPEEAKKTMKRLDDFWFRTWAKIILFSDKTFQSI